MSQSNNNADDPLFIMHIGATYAIRISVLHGSSHGLIALPVHGVVRVRVQGGRGNDAQDVEVNTYMLHNAVAHGKIVRFQVLKMLR